MGKYKGSFSMDRKALESSFRIPPFFKTSMLCIHKTSSSGVDMPTNGNGFGDPNMEIKRFRLSA